MPAQRLIRPTDIADIAAVSPAAVANWRDRQRDTFPAPAGGTAARPLYDYGEVVAWLRENGKNIRETAPGDLLSSTMDTMRGVLSPEEFCDLALSLLVLRKIAHSNRAVASFLADARHTVDGSITDLLHRAAKAEPEHGDLLDLGPARTDLNLPQLTQLFDVIESIPIEDLPSAADAVLIRSVRSQGRGGGRAGAVRSIASQALASLAVRTNVVDKELHPALAMAMPVLLNLLTQANTTDSIYDAASGIGETLLTVHSAKPGAQLIGREINEQALMIARQRAYLLDIDSDDLAQADTVATDPWPGGSADAVVTEPPFGLKLTATLADSDKRWQFGTPNGLASDFAWLQDAIAHTSPGGRAYVMLPAAPLFRAGLALSIRRGMVGAGCVDAVVALPKGILTYTSIPLFIWVLRPKTDPGHSVKFVEIDERGNVRSVDVSTADLLGEASTNLNPRLRLVDLALDQTDHAKVVCEAEQNLNESLRALRAGQPAETPAMNLSGTRVLTVGDLLKSGSIKELRRGSARPAHRDDDSAAVLLPRHVREGIPELPPTSEEWDATALTKRGDVLVATQHKVHARVDTSGGHVVSDQLWILTVDPVQFHPAFVAAAISGSWNERFQMGTAITSANVRDLEIPVPPLSVQDQIVARLEDAAAAQRSAQAATVAAARYSDGLLNAVRYGADLIPSHADESHIASLGSDAQRELRHSDIEGPV